MLHSPLVVKANAVCFLLQKGHIIGVWRIRNRVLVCVCDLFQKPLFLVSTLKHNPRAIKLELCATALPTLCTGAEGWAGAGCLSLGPFTGAARAACSFGGPTSLTAAWNEMERAEAILTTKSPQQRRAAAGRATEPFQPRRSYSCGLLYVDT